MVSVSTILVGTNIVHITGKHVSPWAIRRYRVLRQDTGRTALHESLAHGHRGASWALLCHRADPKVPGRAEFHRREEGICDLKTLLALECWKMLLISFLSQMEFPVAR